MLANTVSDREAVNTALADYRAACQKLTTLEFTAFTVPELLEIQSEREHLVRTTAGVDHRILTALQGQTTAKEIGGKSWADILALRLCISQTAAKARVKDAERLSPRHIIGGETLQPELPACAAALAQGTINLEHTTIIRDVLRKADRKSAS